MLDNTAWNKRPRLGLIKNNNIKKDVHNVQYLQDRT